MKRCPECRRDYYDDTLLYCLDDGSALLEGPASADEPATAMLPDTPLTGSPPYFEAPTRTHNIGDLISREMKHHKFRAAAVAAVVLMVLGGFGYGVYRFLEKPPTASPTRSTSPIAIQRLTGDGKTREAEISPDGKFLVYKRLDKSTESLHIRQIQTGSTVEVAKASELSRIRGLVFSPDGNFIYFSADDRTGDPVAIYRLPTLGGVPTKVLKNASGLQFSPDGKQVTFWRLDPAGPETAIYRANADGSNERKLASRMGKQYFGMQPAWSPDGKLIAVAAGDRDLLPNPADGIVFISADDGSEKGFGSRKWTAITDIVWHPSGDSLVIVAANNDFLPGQIWEVGHPSGETRQLTNNLNGYDRLSITQDGNAIVTVERYDRSAIWVSPDLEAKNARSVMQASGDTWGFSWTPDNRIVYSSNQSGDAEIWIMNADGTDQRQLTGDRTFKAAPAVSPDGRYIVYMSSEPSPRLIRVDINGGGATSLTISIYAENPHISPDSRWVIYSAWVEGSPKILRVPIEGGESHQLTDFFSTGPRYSPDGAVFACFALDAHSQRYNKLAIVPSDGGQPIKMLEVPPGTSIVRGPVWTPDGKAIVVIVTRGELMNLWRIPLDGGAPKQVTDLDVPVVARREYSPDGKQIAIARAEAISNAVMITGFR
jgi:Tol biopolymer transport system component